jgi:hypothetical protein
VSALPDHRPGQPGDLCRLPSPAASQRPHARRPALLQLPPLADRNLRHLRAEGSVRDLAGYRRAMVRACKQRRGRCLGLRPDRPRPGRHKGRASLRHLHPVRCRLLDQLPGLRRDRPDPRRALRPVHPPTGDCVNCSATRPPRSARASAPSTRISRAPNGPALSQPGWTRAPSLDPSEPGHRRRAHPRSPGRAAPRQAGRAPAQRPGRDPDAAPPR